MAFKSQAGIRLALQVCFEVTGQRSESFLLAGEQAPVRIFRGRLGRRKIDAVERKPSLDSADIRLGSWGWSWLHVHGGGGGGSERRIPVITHIACHSNWSMLRSPAVDVSGGSVAGNSVGAGCITVVLPTSFRMACIRCD